MPGFQWSDERPKLIGIAIHQILQNIGRMGQHWWANKTTLEHLYYIKQQLLQLGVLPIYLDETSAVVDRAITNTLTDIRGQWILHTHMEAKSEFPLTALINGKIQNLIIDRTFIDEHGIRWIIDYKSAALSQQDLEDFLVQEQQKYLEKMQTYYQAMRLIDDSPIRLGLYFPALPAWKEWDPELLNHPQKYQDIVA